MRNPDADVVQACAQVYNDWEADFASYNPKRLIGVSVIPMYDVAWAIEELERTLHKGLLNPMINCQAPWSAIPDTPPVLFGRDSGPCQIVESTQKYAYKCRMEFLTTSEAAEYLRLGERKLYELVTESAIPCSKVTGKWLFPRHELDLWVMSGLARPPGMIVAEAPPIVGGTLTAGFWAGGTRYGVATIKVTAQQFVSPPAVEYMPLGSEPVRMSCVFTASPRPLTVSPFSVRAVALVTLLASECSSSTLLATTTPLAFCHGPLPMRSRAFTPASPPGAVVLKYAFQLVLAAPAALASAAQCASAPSRPPRLAPSPLPALVTKKLIAAC